MFMGVKTLHQLDSKKHHDTSNNVLNSIIVNDTFAPMYEALFISQNLCDAAGYVAYKKYNDIQICTRPTCRGILGDGIR